MSYEEYIVVDGSVRNLHEGADIIGFAFESRLAYYRALGLSMVEDIRVTVDDEASYPRKAIRLTVMGTTYTLDELEELDDERWPFTEAATVTVLTPGGLSAGDHELTVAEHLRISYIGTGVVAAVTKHIRVTAQEG